VLFWLVLDLAYEVVLLPRARMRVAAMAMMSWYQADQYHVKDIVFIAAMQRHIAPSGVV